LLQRWDYCRRRDATRSLQASEPREPGVTAQRAVNGIVLYPTQETSRRNHRQIRTPKKRERGPLSASALEARARARSGSRKRITGSARPFRHRWRASPGFSCFSGQPNVLLRLVLFVVYDQIISRAS
jgi:hypothetical protein